MLKLIFYILLAMRRLVLFILLFFAVFSQTADEIKLEGEEPEQ